MRNLGGLFGAKVSTMQPAPSSIELSPWLKPYERRGAFMCGTVT